MAIHPRNLALGLLMILYAYLLTKLWFPMGLADHARQHAEAAQPHEGTEPGHGQSGGPRDKLLSRDGWRQIARAFFMEWKMVYKEILFGFTVAGCPTRNQSKKRTGVSLSSRYGVLPTGS